MGMVSFGRGSVEGPGAHPFAPSTRARVRIPILSGGIALGIIALAFAVLRSQADLAGFTAAGQASEVTIAVHPGTEVGTLNTQLSTNLVWPDMLENSPGAKSLLSAWAPPLVRIHAGADFSPSVLPAGLDSNDWNFASLDRMMAAVRAYGSQPVLNVRYAPTWMWTCSTPFDGGRAGVGSLSDDTFKQYGDYMARLVGWYNKGGFTDEGGVFHRSDHQNWVSYWEIWNEPDLSDETPCHSSDSGAALTPDQYTAMWNVVARKMLAVDSALKLVGPVTSGPAPEYVQNLMQGAQRPPDALSYHLYGGGSNSDTDQSLLDNLPSTSTLVDARWGRPFWVTEINVNSAWLQNDPTGRPAGPFGVAWGASAFRAMSLAGVALIHQFDFVDGPQFGLVDDTSGATRLTYWRDVLLSRAFPPGSRMVGNSSSTVGIESLAVRRPDGSLSVMIVNRSVAGRGDVGGKGRPATVTVHIDGPTPSAVRLRQLDRTSDPTREPPVHSVAPSSDVRLVSPGYGITLLEIVPAAPAAPEAAAPAPAAPAPAATAAPTPPPPSAVTTQAEAPALAHDARYFWETGFRIDDDSMWHYFQSRGQNRAFGYPVSRTFVFLGCSVQIFQRQVTQLCAGSSVSLLNILDPEILPYTRINGSTLPAVDEVLKSGAPKVTDPNYASAVIDFVRANVPDEVAGQPTGFSRTFFGTITAEEAGEADRGILDLLNLELWGIPLSAPEPDPSNADFIYQRFQRGVMHYSVSAGITQGVLIADYLKQVLLNGPDLPVDLRDEARTSKLFAQYCPVAPHWLCRPDELPATDLTFAFQRG